MKRALVKSGVSVGLLLTLMVTLACFALPRPAVGRVIPLREVPPHVNTVEGVVEVSSDDGKTWTPVTQGMHISAGQILRTASDGTVVLDSSDGTVVALQPLSTIVPLPDDRSLRLLIFAGSVWVQYASVTDGDRNGVSAPRVTAVGLEPCTFVLDLVELATTVRVLDGRVGLQHDSTGDTSEAVAGEAATATPTGFQPEPDFDPDVERALWEPLLSGTTTTSIPGETTRTSTGRTTSTLADTGTNPPPGGRFRGELLAPMGDRADSDRRGPLPCTDSRGHGPAGVPGSAPAAVSPGARPATPRLRVAYRDRGAAGGGLLPSLRHGAHIRRALLPHVRETELRAGREYPVAATWLVGAQRECKEVFLWQVQP